jgi:outer membrane protein OmpA-like peptidoglycan-associated protein
MLLRILFIFLLMSLHARAAAQPANDTFSIYFELGQPELTQKAITKMDSLLYHDVINSSTQLIIVGYADFLGAEESNKSLSEARSQNVLEHLTSMGVRKSNVQLCIGKGEVDREVKRQDGYPADRRVDVVVDRVKMARTPVVKQVPKAPAKVATPTSQPSVPARRPSSSGPAIDLSSLKPGQTIVLENLYFHPGRHFIKEESITILEKLHETLEANSDLKIQIEGHVCCVTAVDAIDEDTFQLALSLNRAKYIYQYLVKNGIDRERLKYKGFGRSRPVVPVERTAEDEDKNRRVEIRVIE